MFRDWPAAPHPTPVTARPPAGRAGRGGFRRREGSFPLPKPAPWGEGGPAKPGRMRGRFATQPFLVEKGRSPDCRLNEVFLLPRWATRSPPHQSPSVTASPQGEASGPCSPTRKSVPNQGTQMGTVIAPQPEQCATTAKTSECQRAGHKMGGRGPSPATLCVRAFSRESLDPRPGPGGKPRGRSGSAMGLPEPPIRGSTVLRTLRVDGSEAPLGRCAPRLRKSPDHPKGTQYRPGAGSSGAAFLTNSDTSYSPSAPSCGSRGSKSASAGGGSWG